MGAFRAPLRTGEPEQSLLAGKLTGTGAASPTKSEGLNGVTCAWVSTGVYDFTFEAPISEVVALHPGKWATTITNIDGWDVIFGALNTTTRKLRMSVVNESNTLADLAAATGLYVAFLVKA